MTTTRWTVMIAGTLGLLLSITSSAQANPSEESEKITYCMRELQGRHKYLYDSGLTNLTTPYYNWNDDGLGLSLCSNFVTPYFPPSDWYEYDLKESPNPALRAKNIVFQVFLRFQNLYVNFVRQKHWDLEAKKLLSGPSGIDSYTGKIYLEGIMYGQWDIGEDFPQLTIFDHDYEFEEFSYPYYRWKEVTEDNYRDILDELCKAIEKLRVVQTRVNPIDHEVWYGSGSSIHNSCEEAKAFASGCNPAEHEPPYDEYWCGGWNCPHRGRGWEESNCCGLGITEQTVGFIYAFKSAGRFALTADLTGHKGSGKVYMRICPHPNGWSNLGGLKSYNDEWQQIESVQAPSVYLSGYFANFEPTFTVNCTENGQTKGWSPKPNLEDSLILISAEFETRVDPGIEYDGLSEDIYKDRDEKIVYTIHEDCPQDTGFGEVIDLLIPCPWYDVTEDTKLSAYVKVISKDTRDVACVLVGNWDGEGSLLDSPEQYMCVPKGPCSNCGLVLWDAATQSYRLKLSVAGRRGGPKQFSFKVVYWFQNGDITNLDSRCAEKVYSFTAIPNRYACCAKGEKCNQNGCYIGVLKRPEIKKMSNGDTQIYFPDPSQTYIFEQPRPGFIDDVTLVEYNQTTLNLINANNQTVPLTSVVVLRYKDGLGIVYQVPSTWWSTTNPSGKGELKYIIDEEGKILKTVETLIDGTIKVTPSDNSGYTEYKFTDAEHPDRITQIVKYDSTGYSGSSRQQTVSYDDAGRITYISDGGTGCQSCGGGEAGLDYVYDDQGNVLQEKDSEGTVRYEYRYDTKNRMIGKWQGLQSLGNLVKEVVYTDSDTGTVAASYTYLDSNNYRLEMEHFDVSGRLLKRIQYENLNENPDSPTGKCYTTSYYLWPPSDSNPLLQAYWKLDEQSGGRVQDSSIYKRHGILRNYSSAGWSSGITNNALTITGSNDYRQYLSVPGYKGIIGTNPRTISAWIKPTAAGRIIRWGSNQAGQNWDIRVESTGKLKVDVEGGSVETNNNIDFITNPIWRHVAVVLGQASEPNVSDITVYMNGTLIAENNLSRTNSEQLIQTADTDDVVLGGAYTVGSTEYYYDGQIDEAMIIEGALTANQIKQLYDYQNRYQTNEYTETTAVISPKDNFDGTGPHWETVRTFKNSQGDWYLQKEQQLVCGLQAVPVEQSASEYAAINNNGVLLTRLWESRNQGAETIYSYEDQAHLTRMTSQMQPLVTTPTGTVQLRRWYDYDSQGRMKEEREYVVKDTPEFLVAHHYLYDIRGNLIKQYLRDNEYPTEEQQIIEYKYNGFNEEVLSKSAEGVVSGKEYNTQGQVISEFVLANPADWTQAPSAYREKFLLSASEENRLQVMSLTRYQYDSKGRIQYIYKAKCDKAFAYCSVDDPADGVTWTTVEYGYDDYGNRTEIKQYVTGLSAPLLTEYKYNRLGEQEMVILPTKRYQRTEKDGRALTKKEIVGYINSSNQEIPIGITQYGYDENGNLKKQVYPDGNSVENVYDAWDRIKKVYRGVVTPDQQ